MAQHAYSVGHLVLKGCAGHTGHVGHAGHARHTGDAGNVGHESYKSHKFMKIVKQIGSHVSNSHNTSPEHHGGPEGHKS